MRFLILTQYFPPEIGAPQVRLGALTRELVRLGHEVEVVTALPNHPTGRILPEYRRRFYWRETRDGAIVHRVWLYASVGAGLKRIVNYLSFTATCFWGLLRARRPDYVFVESPPLFLSVPGALAASIWRAPVIFNVADLWPDSVRELGLMREGLALRLADALERWTYRHCDYVNAVTEGIREMLTGKKGVPAAKVLFLPNGVDTETFKPAPADAAIERELGLAGQKLIVYAGTLGYAQGLEVALEAMTRLQVEAPEALLLFIGDGSEKERLVRRTAELGLQNVRFLAPQPPEYVARLYSVAYAGFASLKNLPLFEGARPSKLFPIMAAGKPVVYSGAGEAVRLIKGAQAGLTVAPEDAAALADTLLRLLRSPGLAAELGSNGRAYVETKLSWRMVVEQWLQQLGVSARGEAR
ncbi:MAG: glycosyltransferase family 4 protein [Bacteroidota bacterium]